MTFWNKFARWLQKIVATCYAFSRRQLAPFGMRSQTFVRQSKIFVWGARTCYKKIIASQKNNTSHHNMLLYFVIILQSLPSQTKILEVRTNFSECGFEALFKGVSTVFGPRNVETCFENALWNVGSAFQNLRLGGVNFARWLQKIVASQENQHIASHATIFCNHLAKLLQKIVASQKPNTSHHMLQRS